MTKEERYNAVKELTTMLSSQKSEIDYNNEGYFVFAVNSVIDGGDELRMTAVTEGSTNLLCSMLFNAVSKDEKVYAVLKKTVDVFEKSMKLRTKTKDNGKQNLN